jgi:hypothetical protein
MFVDINALNIQALIYDPRYHDFESWASLMCEAFASNQLEIPDAQTNWQEWALGLKAIDLFNNEAVPSPYEFENWDEWVAQTINAYQPRT